MKNGYLWLAIVAMALSGQCCHKQTAAVPADMITGTGTIKQVGVEGGFFGIVGDDGQNYDPQNLPAEYKIDGLKVKYQLKKKEDQASFHMWGIVVEVSKIEKRD